MFVKGEMSMEKNEEVKVSAQPVAEETKVEAPKTDEKKAVATPKKRAPKSKNDSTKKATVKEKAEKTVTAKKTTTAKRTTKKAAKSVAEKTAPAAKTESKKAPVKSSRATKFNFAKTQFEFGGKKYTEETINSLVLEYLDKHPYISASQVEIFVNVDERKLYFTLDGYGNVDFEIDL